MRSTFALILCTFTFSLATQLIGSISSTVGGTPKYATITAIDVSTGETFTTETFGSSYNLSLPDGPVFDVSATASNNISVSTPFTTWFVPGFFPLIVGKISVTSDATFNLTFEPCFTLVLEDYTSNGQKSYDDFPYWVWTTDQQGGTTRGAKVRVQSATSDTLGLAVSLGTVNYISTQRTIVGAGDITLIANNNGAGYTSQQQGGITINIATALANTYLRTLRAKSQDANFSTDSYAALYLTQPNPSVAAVQADSVISQGFGIETNMELARASGTTDQYRSTNITVKATDESGRPVPGLTIQMTQTSVDFKFGVYGGPDIYNATGPWEQLVAAGINSATVDFWWSITEPMSGQIDEDYIISQKIDYLLSLGLKLRATGLFQPHPSILPAYVRNMQYEDFSRALYEHVYNIVKKYCTGFDVIEVSTDLNALAHNLGFDATQVVALQGVSLSAINAAVPGVKTTVTATIVQPLDTHWNTAASPLAFARQWTAAGQNVDQLGLSVYNPQAIASQLSIGGLSDQLDAQAALARPLVVSRLSAPTAIPFSSQPTFLEQFYEVAYSKKYVKEITWWGMIGSDSTLFDENLTPTPLFRSLKKMIQKLNRPATNVPLSASGFAAVTTRGGTYSVTVSKDGAVVGTTTVRFDEARNTKMSVVYRDGKAIILMNPTNGPIVGVAPAPLSIVDNGAPAPKTLPTWAVLLIVFGTTGVVAIVGAAVAVTIVRRSNRTPGRFTPETPAHLKPVANVAAVSFGVAPKTFDIPFEEPVVTPDTWQGQPLSIVIPMEDSGEEEQGMEEESETSESSLEDVELDGNEDISSETSESEDEHL